MVKLNGIAVAIYFAFSLIILVCALVFIRLRLKTKIKPFLIGGLTWLLFATMLEGSVHGVVLSIFPGLRENTLAFAIYGGLMAGIFEELGRYLAFKVFFKRDMENDKNALAYAAGHGGFEAAILFGSTMISNIVISIMLNNGMTSALTATATAETLPQIEAMFESLKTTAPYTYFIGLLERFFAVAVQLSLSVFVWFAAKDGRKWYLYPLAILLHFLVDGCLVVVAQYFTSYWIIYGILLLETAAVALLAYAIWKRNAKKEQTDADQAV